MVETDFTINATPTLRLHRVGREQTCVIVVDSLLADIEVLRSYACAEAEFQSELQTSYPGVRARLPQCYVSAMAPLIHQLISTHYPLTPGQRLTIPAGFFSLVATPPDALTPDQQIPHFDSAKAGYFAVMQYVNEGHFGGTSFYRHRATEYENVSPEREANYLQRLSRRRASEGRCGYIRESDDSFEKIDSIPYRANRLVIYPSSLLHSGDIDATRDICTDPARGRLTTNLFIDYR